MPEPKSNLNYFQAIYITFWKPIFAALAFAHMLLAAWVIKMIWVDPIGYAYAVAFLCIVPIAYVELEWFGRAIGATDEPMFDFKRSATWLVAIGYAIALGLAIFLAVNESNARVSNARASEEMAADREKLHQMMNDPNVQRANEALKARQAKEAADKGK